MPPSFTVGLDLGQLSDHTALAVLEHAGPGRAPHLPDQVFHVTYLYRYPLGTPYPAVVEDLCGLMDRPPLDGAARLAIDATGVGVAVVDLLRQAARWPPVVARDRFDRPVHAPPGRPRLRAKLTPVTITAGNEVTSVNRGYGVPKRDLVAAAQVALQGDRLRIAPGLPHAATLVRELEAFRYKLSPSGRDSYGVGAEWREGAHDDLLLAVATALWVAQHVRAGTVRWI